MTRPTRRTLGLALIALLATAPGLRAGVITAIDPGAGPTSSLSVSSAQLQLFQTEVNTGSEILVNFGGISATNAPTADGKWFSVNAAGTVQVETSGTDHGTPPSGFQYGVAVSSNTTDKAFNNPTVGFNISGDQRFEFVPKLNASASSVTFRSSTPFQAFGFYLTGLGDQTGTLTLTFPGGSPQVIPGATGGGAEFVQYVGDGSPISQLGHLSSHPWPLRARPALDAA